MKKRGSFLMILGLLLLAAALILAGYNTYESERAAMVSNKAVEGIFEEIERKMSPDGEEQDLVDFELFPDKEMPTILIDQERYCGVLEFPDLDMTIPVMSGEWNYAKLKKAPCLYSGSVYQNDMAIAGHNYRSHFGRIKTLHIGSEIRFIDLEGNVFTYTVGWFEVLQKTDVELMTDPDGWDMTLFTCTYGGRERYTVRCIRTEN